MKRPLPRQRNRYRHPGPASRRPSAGFTLSEVLVAIGILALGTVAVASLFPTAAFLQKEAVKETLRQNHIRSADAILEGVGISNSQMLLFRDYIEGRPTTSPALTARAGITDPAFDVFALSEVDILLDAIVTPPVNVGGSPDMAFGSADPTDSFVYDTTVFPAGRFPEGMRSLPTTIPGGLNGGVVEYRNREVYWVPLIRSGLEASENFPDWSVYAFVLQPDSQLRNVDAYANANYPAAFNGLVCANPFDQDYFPKVFRVPVTWNPNNPQRATPSVNLFGFVKPGEKVLGDNGVIYRVSQIDSAAGTMILAEDTEFSPINQRDLGAVWIAPAPGGIDQNSPLADIRLLSNTVVRTNDF